MKNFFYFLLITILFGLNSCDTKDEKQKLNWSKFIWTSDIIDGKIYTKTAQLVPFKFENNPKQYYMQLDIGADANILYGIPYYQIINSKHTNDTAKFVTINGEVGNFKFKNATFYVMKNFGSLIDPKDTLPNIGTIGLEFFKNKILVINFPNQKFLIIDSSSTLPTSIIDTAQMIDVVIRNNKLFIPVQTADTVFTNFFFDTGSSRTYLKTTKSLWQKLTGRKGNEKDNIYSKEWAWGKEILTVSAPSKTYLIIAGVKFTNPIVSFDSMRVDKFENWPFKVDGLIGNALFYDKYTIVIDFVNNKFGLVENK